MSLAPHSPAPSSAPLSSSIHPVLVRHAAGARFGRARQPFAVPSHGGAVPGVVVQAVLQFADERTERPDGRLALRLTRERLGEHAVRVVLGPHVDRARRLCILWDPAEGQIVEIGEDELPAPQLLCGSEDELWDEARAAA